MAAYANKKRAHVEFAIGTHVWLSSEHLQNPPHSTRKLLPKFVGPYKVLARVGPVAYRLELPRKLSGVHPVFHVSQLKLHQGPVTSGPEALFATPEGDHFEVEAILAHRGTASRREFLIHWLGYPAHEQTWEPEGNLAGA